LTKLLLGVIFALAFATIILNVSYADSIHDFQTKKVHVNDIDVAYKMFGKGDPIVLINGFMNTLDDWPPILLDKLAENHTVITFSNRGVGNTSTGDKGFSITQFAQDTTDLLDALNINKTDVLGFSMGGRIAQQLTLSNPEKVDKLIIYASGCGGKQGVPADKDVMKVLADKSIDPSEMKAKLRPLLYPEGFDFSILPKSEEKVSDRTILEQQKAIANWPGVCNKLKNIEKETLVIVGSDDNLAPPANSLLMSHKIPGSWFVQISGAGHALAMQMPLRFSNIVLVFLES
jgi:pimeloyl-ACP methyl ester carboxylesterase